MKSVFVVLGVGTLAFFAAEFDPAREMWAPLIVSVVPLLAFMMWPVRDRAGKAGRAAGKAAA
ncbi:MAG: hypothetical protein EXQ48_07950 [Acidobacteria bacterium]|nr:hypothetical protein [Acidobacteriota bacterium]